MAELKDSEFAELREIMHKRTGVYLKDTKRPLVITRLRKRLEELDLSTYGQYIEQLDRKSVV